jgi:plastocyanin
MTPRQTWICVLMVGACLVAAQAQTATVRGRLDLVGGGKASQPTFPATVVWLTPVSGTAGDLPPFTPSPSANLRLVQKNKSFEPHILVAPVGSVVEFPNRDPYFHNVFSLFEGKRFDLGLYEAGSSRIVHFDRVGVSYIFCNIHPEMSAVVITLATPFYAISTSDGHLSIPNVPYGRYLLHVWTESVGSENAQPPAREITITEGAPSLGMIRVPAPTGQTLAHKNKYGRDYDQPTPDSPIYH